MDIAPTYNGLGDRIRRCITWQFDNAPHLIGLIGIIDSFYRASTETLFNTFLDSIFNLDNANSFGLAVWGYLLGFPRPTWNDGSTPTPISDDYYSRLLKARAFLLSSNYSMADVARAAYIAYGNRYVPINGKFISGTEISHIPGYLGYIRNAPESKYSPAPLSSEEAWLTWNNPEAAFWLPAGMKMYIFSHDQWIWVGTNTMPN